jgi:undecaprenyl-diphosphatase
MWQYLPPLDRRIAEWSMRRWQRNPTLDAAMVVLATWTPVVMLALIVLAGLGAGLPPELRDAAQRHGLCAVSAAVCVRILNEPVSRLAARPRPFETLGVAPLVGHERGGSFPSNHAAGAFALTAAMSAVPGYGSLLWVLAFAVSLARVYGGLHHLTDVVGGALHGLLVGSVAAALCA